jgi:hypothetical protein
MTNIFQTYHQTPQLLENNPIFEINNLLLDLSSIKQRCAKHFKKLNKCSSQKNLQDHFNLKLREIQQCINERIEVHKNLETLLWKYSGILSDQQIAAYYQDLIDDQIEISVNSLLVNNNSSDAVKVEPNCSSSSPSSNGGSPTTKIINKRKSQNNEDKNSDGKQINFDFDLDSDDNDNDHLNSPTTPYRISPIIPIITPKSDPVKEYKQKRTNEVREYYVTQYPNDPELRFDKRYGLYKEICPKLSDSCSDISLRELKLCISLREEVTDAYSKTTPESSSPFEQDIDKKGYLSHRHYIEALKDKYAECSSNQRRKKSKKK